MIKFEKYLIAFLTISSGIVVIYLSIIGPLIAKELVYKTSQSAINQLYGQDITNMIFLGPVLILSGILLLLNKEVFRHLLILTPLAIIYYALSVVVGLEWSSTEYAGNSEHYFYYFLYLIISSLVIMFYAISQVSNKYQVNFSKKFLVIYSVVFILALIMFAKMWITGVNEVINTGSSIDYNDNPTLFWTIRTMDLGFVIPLGFISLYLLWTRPNQSIPVILLFYGFFITMGISVNAMGISMFVNNDPTINVGGMSIFIVLLLVVCSGYYFLLKNIKKQTV
ncbi:MAG: hypothetical protein K0Q49_1516 [Haloplasmataceae bacterium]|jgi:hypothetical protein|nr:hypothetical protein [Haloplasmataceae bacterium]